MGVMCQSLLTGIFVGKPHLWGYEGLKSHGYWQEPAACLNALLRKISVQCHLFQFALQLGQFAGSIHCHLFYMKEIDLCWYITRYFSWQKHKLREGVFSIDQFILFGHRKQIF